MGTEDMILSYINISYTIFTTHFFTVNINHDFILIISIKIKKQLIIWWEQTIFQTILHQKGSNSSQIIWLQPWLLMQLWLLQEFLQPQEFLPIRTPTYSPHIVYPRFLFFPFQCMFDGTKMLCCSDFLKILPHSCQILKKLHYFWKITYACRHF